MDADEINIFNKTFSTVSEITSTLSKEEVEILLSRHKTAKEKIEKVITILEMKETPEYVQQIQGEEVNVKTMRQHHKRQITLLRDALDHYEEENN